MKKAKARKIEYEIVMFKCPNCGKEIQMVKHKSLSIKGLLCQKCGLGEEKPED